MPRTWPVCTKSVWSSTTNFSVKFSGQIFPGLWLHHAVQWPFLFPTYPRTHSDRWQLLGFRKWKNWKTDSSCCHLCESLKLIFLLWRTWTEKLFLISFYCHPCKTTQLLFMHLVTSEEKQEKQKSWSNNNYTFFCRLMQKKKKVVLNAIYITKNNNTNSHFTDYSALNVGLFFIKWAKKRKKKYNMHFDGP